MAGDGSDTSKREGGIVIVGWWCHAMRAMMYQQRWESPSTASWQVLEQAAVPVAANGGDKGSVDVGGHDSQVKGWWGDNLTCMKKSTIISGKIYMLDYEHLLK